MDLPLVRKFYANLVPNADKSSFSSLYQGHAFNLNPSIIKGFLDGTLLTKTTLPTGGYRINLSRNAFESLPEYDSTSNFNSLFEPQFAAVESKSASHLTINNRLLHHIVVNSIIPHEGSGTTLNKVRLCILWCLNRRIPIDLPYAMFTHMIYARTHGTHAYPYAMFITRFIMANFPVRTVEPLVIHYRIFDDAALGQLFRKAADGTWMKTPANSAKRARTSGTPSLSASIPSPPISQPIPIDSSHGSHPTMSMPDVPPSSYTLTPPSSASFDHAHAYDTLISRFDSMNLRFDEVTNRMNALDTSVTTIANRLNIMAGLLRRDIREHHERTDSYGDASLNMILHLEDCLRLLSVQTYNLNQRMHYMDRHLATRFNLDAPPAYIYFQPAPRAPRHFDEMDPQAQHPPQPFNRHDPPNGH